MYRITNKKTVVVDRIEYYLEGKQTHIFVID